MGRTIGIDLGTTNSAIAVVDDDGTPQIIVNRDGDRTMPSAVMFPDFGGGDEPLVGVQARDMATSSPEDVVQYVKRHMGDPNWRFDSASGATYSAEEVSALILKRLKADAEAALGESVTDAVITVPAYFDDARRTATRQAGEIAGLNVIRVLNEPTAAALAYGLEKQLNATVLVFDLGGGTFDATLIRIHNGTFDVLGTDGDRNLGGFDFDNELALLIASEMEAQGADSVASDLNTLADLRHKAQQAKHALSTTPTAQVHVAHRGRPHRVVVRHEMFDDATRTLVTRTREIVDDVLDDAGVSWSAIDEIVLVGGSTRIPAIRDMLERASGLTISTTVNPDEAVALGAAVQAAVLTEPEASTSGSYTEPGMPQPHPAARISIADVTSQALGTLALDEHGQDRNWVLIPRNSKVPATGSDFFSTLGERTELQIVVTEGEDSDPDFVTDIGMGTVKLSTPMPEGTTFEVLYKYDADQRISVELFDTRDDSFLGRFHIDRSSNLDQAGIQKARTRVSNLTSDWN